MVSRVAKQPVTLPTGVEATLQKQLLSIKGKLGELSQLVHDAVSVDLSDSTLTFKPINEETESNALAGTMQSLAKNMVLGVSEGFVRKLKLVGVGYRAVVQGKVIDLSLGFSHPVNFQLPEGVTAETPSATEIILKGVDKQKVNQTAANIRHIRPPEPYKGKGVRYDDEVIILKEGKKK